MGNDDSLLPGAGKGVVQDVEDFLFDYTDSVRLDARLDVLRAEDPEASEIFAGLSFVTQHMRGNSGGGDDPLVDAVARYATAKYAQGRPDLYHALFADEND